MHIAVFPKLRQKSPYKHPELISAGFDLWNNISEQIPESREGSVGAFGMVIAHQKELLLMCTLPHVQLLGKQELMWLDKRAQSGGENQ